LWPTGSALEHEILAVVRPEEAQLHLSTVFRRVAALRFVPSLAAFENTRHVEAPLLGLLYFDGHEDAADPNWVATVKRFSERRSAIPLVAYASLTPIGMHQCWRAGQAGVGAMVVRGSEDLLHMLGPILERQSARPFMRDIRAELLGARAQPGKHAWRVMRYCLKHARDRLTVEDLSVGIGVSSRTAAAHLEEAELPFRDE
jgi:hypothetical protein